MQAGERATMSSIAIRNLDPAIKERLRVCAGIEILPDGRRRNALEKAAHAMFADDFDGRILPFDREAAAAYADIFAAHKRAGRPTAPHDFMIASIARSHDANMVTRDISGFEGCGLPLINPWEAYG